MHIGLISAAFPPDLDGIGDYTWWMAKTLGELGHRVTVFTRKGAVSEVPGGTVVSFFDPAAAETFADLLPVWNGLKLADRPEWMVLQYNPFSWGPRGFCAALPKTLKTWRGGPGMSCRLAVMFHETQVPRWPWRFAVMRTWQNWFFKQICLLADWTFVSTERWLPEVASVDPRAKAMVLPVGSNIPVSRLERVAARTKLDLPGDAFIAGIFGSAHTSRRLDWVAAAAQQYQAQRKALLVLHVGPDGDAVASELAGVPFKTQGPLPAEEVADALRAMDCLVTPFTDGVSTRRGSVMAALLNGVPVATTIRAWTDAVFKRADPRTLLLSSAMNSESFANDATRWMRELEPQTGDLAQSFAFGEFDWPIIARAMIDALASTSGGDELATPAGKANSW